MTKSIVLFFIAKSGLKRVYLVCLTLFTTQSLNWTANLQMLGPSYAITLAQEKRKILSKVLILLHIWTQNKVLLFKHKVQMFTF